MKTIMVTAFEPFGFRNTSLLSKNASKEVLQALAPSFGSDVLREVLPVSSDSENVLMGLLALHRPAGILLMGEQLVQSPGAIRVEPYANDTPLTLAPLFGGINRIVSSPFAAHVLEGKLEPSSIQTQQCNRCYLRALGWADSNGSVPVVFIHIPVFGDRTLHTKQVLKVFHLMREFVNTPA